MEKIDLRPRLYEKISPSSSRLILSEVRTYTQRHIRPERKIKANLFLLPPSLCAMLNDRRED